MSNEPTNTEPQKSILQTINDHNNTPPSLANYKELRLGSWWRDESTGLIYQLRRIPQSMDKINDKESGIVLWHRDMKVCLHLPLSNPHEFTYLGEGHDPSSLSEV